MRAVDDSEVHLLITGAPDPGIACTERVSDDVRVDSGTDGAVMGIARSWGPTSRARMICSPMSLRNMVSTSGPSPLRGGPRCAHRIAR